MASGFQDFLDKYGGDKKITGSEIRDFGDSGGSQQKAEDYLAKIQNQQDKENKAAAGVQIGDKAFTAAGKEKNFGGSTGGGISVDPADNASAGGTSGYSGTDIDLGAYEEMARIDTANQDFLNQGLYNSNQLINSINAEANVAVAQAYAGATKYASDTDLQIADLTSAREQEWRMYMADQDRLKGENVATIQGEYSLDLQAIVNAGAADVAKIQGEYGLASDKLRGEYSLEGERIRGDTARDVASRQKEAQIFGSLLSGFWA
jgi:hypothetical protein